MTWWTLHKIFSSSFTQKDKENIKNRRYRKKLITQSKLFLKGFLQILNPSERMITIKKGKNNFLSLKLNY